MNNIRKQPIYTGYSNDPEAVAFDTWPYPGQIGGRVTIAAPPANAMNPGAEQGRSKTYQLVVGDSTMSVAPFHGAVMWWANKAQYKVTTSPTAISRNAIAGVYQVASGATSAGKGQAFFIQTEGPATTKVIDASALATAVGDTCIPSSTAGKADRVAAGTAPTYIPLGVFATVCNPNAEAIVDLDLPQTP